MFSNFRSRWEMPAISSWFVPPIVIPIAFALLLVVDMVFRTH